MKTILNARPLVTALTAIFVAGFTPQASAQTSDKVQETPLTPVPPFTSPPSVTLPPAVPASQSLTLGQAEDRAVAQNPQLLAALATMKGARSNYVGQRAPINPTLNFSGINNTVSSADFGDASNYEFLFTLETNGAMQWRSSTTRNQWLGAQSDLETAKISVRQSVGTAYVALQVANRQLEIEKDSYSTARQLADLTEGQFKLGAAPETNAIRARIALTQEESNLMQAVNTVAAARAALDIAIGREAKEPIDAAEPLQFKPVNTSLADLRKLALVRRPEIQSAGHYLDAAKANVGLQRTQYLPDLFLATDLHAIHNGTFQVGFTMPLFDFGSIRGNVHQAEHTAEAQSAQSTQTTQLVTLDVENAYNELERAQNTVIAFQDGILNRALGLLQRVEQGYKLGANTILDLIDAQTTYRSSQNDYANALGDHRRAIVNLEHAIGGPIPTPAPADQGAGSAVKEN